MPVELCVLGQCPVCQQQCDKLSQDLASTAGRMEGDVCDTCHGSSHRAALLHLPCWLCSVQGVLMG